MSHPKTTMLVPVLGFLMILTGVGLIIAIIAFKKAPPGYEDREGFHKGEDPDKLNSEHRQHAEHAA